MKMRLLTLCLALAMCVSLFAGCGQGGGNEITGTMTAEEIKTFEAQAGGLKLPLDDKGTTITIFASSSHENLNDTAVIKELSRRTGLNVELQLVPAASAAEKARVLIASRTNLPDVFGVGVGFEEINDLGPQGAFVAIDEYIDKLPNFKDLFVTRAEELRTEKVMKSWFAADQHMYQMPSYGINRDVNNGMLYRKDIFDKHGLTLWDGPESYYQTLKKLKELYPDSSPMSSKAGINIFGNLIQSWGIPNWPGLFYDHDAKTWKYAATDERFKELLDYVKKLYDERLLDQEFLTLTQAAWTSKMTQTDKAFTTSDWIGRLEMFYEQTKATNPEYDLRYANPIGPVQKIAPNSPVSGGTAFTKNENSELSLKLFDYLLSEGGAELMTCGIEGVTFEWNEDKTFAKYLGFEEGKAVSITDLEDKYGMCVGSVAKRYDRRSTYFNYTEKEQEAQDMMNNMPGGGYLKENPALTYLPEEKEIITKYEPDLRKRAEEFASSYILSNDPSKTGDAAWKAFLAEMESKGVNEMIRVSNAAQVRYDAQ